MADVFLAGPLLWPELLRIVLGRDVPEDLPLAQSEGLFLETGAPGVPMLQAGAGGLLSGGLLTLQSREEFARLDFFTCVFGSTPVPKHVTFNGEQIAAVAFLVHRAHGQPTCRDWDLQGWVAAQGGVALEAAAEIMGYFGRISPEDLIWRVQMILSRAAARVAALKEPAPVTHRSTCAASDVVVEAQSAPHEGFFLTRTYTLQHPKFDGTMSASIQREVFVGTDAVIVLPYDPVRDRVMLVEQFRMGPFGRGDPYPWMLEAVAGRVDAGESREQAARRECKEEAGLTLQQLEHVSSHYCSTGCSTEFHHCYVALADLPDTARQRGGLDTEHEDIQTHILDFKAAHDMIRSGEAKDAPLVLLLLWLRNERARLRA